MVPRAALTGSVGLAAMARNVGPVFAIEGGPVIVTGYLNAAATADRRFVSHIGGQLAALRPVLGDGLATAPTDSIAWNRGRDVLAPAFTPQRLQRAIPAFERAATELARKWVGPGSHDVTDDVMRASLEGIALALAGVTWEGPTADIPEHLHRAVMAAKEGRTVADADLVSLRVFTDAVVTTHRNEREPTEDPDILGQILRGHTTTGENLTDDEVHQQMLTLLVAGHETTGSLIAFAIYELLTHPAIKHELESAVRHIPGEPELDAAALAQIPLLDQVVRETLRLHSPAIALTLTPTEEVALPCGVVVLPGDEVLVLVDSVHRDPVWSHPHEFDPSRFAPEHRGEIPRNGWIPFGFGPRTCIGRNLAMLHASTTLAVLLQEDLAPADPHYVLRVRETLTPVPDGFRVRATTGVGGQR